MGHTLRTQRNKTEEDNFNNQLQTFIARIGELVCTQMDF